MSKRVVTAALVLGLASLSGTASAATVFSDNFEDGDVSDWSVSHSANISVPVLAIRTDSVHAGVGALWTYFDAPSGGTGAGYVRASHDFTAAAGATDFVLDLWARSSPCQGCTMFYDVLLDGQQLTHDASAQSSFMGRTFSLGTLATGKHTLTLGMYTTGASSGRFNATFDDIVISANIAAVPEPESYSMLLAGLCVVTTLARRRLLR
ncbi:MAG TPA: PEP-CTERM sorting domain-containing protein [Methyloversatilis sp.]